MNPYELKKYVFQLPPTLDHMIILSRLKGQRKKTEAQATKPTTEKLKE